MNILIVDDNEVSLDLIEMYLESYFDVTPLTASSGNKAIKLIEEGFIPDLILSDYNMPDGNGGKLFHFYLEQNLKCPFALLSAEPLDFLKEFSDIKDPALFLYLQKPYNGVEFNEAIGTLINFKKEKKIDFMKLKIEKFLKYVNSSVDVYLKLSDEKFIKVSNREDKASTEQLQRFIDKGEINIYLTPKDFLAFIENGMELANQGLKTQSGVKLINTQKDAIENIHDSLLLFGVNKKTIETANNCFESTLQNIQKNNALKSLLPNLKKGDENFKYSLSVASSYFSVAMGLSVDFCDNKGLEKLAMAAMFQDIGLDDPKLLKISSIESDNFKKLSKKDKTRLLEHPAKSVELIDKAMALPTDIKNIISEHHERPGQVGFPRGLAANTIAPLSCIFILSHELANKILLDEEESFNNLAFIKAGFEARYNKGNFKKVFDAFSSVFTKLK